MVPKYINGIRCNFDVPLQTLVNNNAKQKQLGAVKGVLLSKVESLI